MLPALTWQKQGGLASMRNVAEDPPAVPLLDINRENRLVRDEIQQAMARVCDQGCFLHGDEVRKLGLRSLRVVACRTQYRAPRDLMRCYWR